MSLLDSEIGMWQEGRGMTRYCQGRCNANVIA